MILENALTKRARMIEAGLNHFLEEGVRPEGAVTEGVPMIEVCMGTASWRRA